MNTIGHMPTATSNREIGSNRVIQIFLHLLVISACLLTRLAESNFGLSGIPLVLVLTGLFSIVVVLPWIGLFPKGTPFDLFHPLVFGTLTFNLPQIIISALYYLDLNIDLHLPQVAALQDRYAIFSTSLYYCILGTLGMTAGYFFIVRKPAVLRQGTILDRPYSALRPHFYVLLGIGAVSTIVLLLAGIGTTLSDGRWIFSGVFSMLAYASPIVYFAAWYAFFRKEKGWLIPFIFFLIFTGIDFLVSGSRGVPLNVLILILGVRQTLPQRKNFALFAVVWVPVGLIFLIGGFYFGTAIRESSRRFADAEGTRNIDVFQILGLSQSLDTGTNSQDTLQRLEDVGNTIVLRATGGLIAMSVIVEYADYRKGGEVEYGIDNQIINDFLTSFLPRFLFPERKNIGTSQPIGALYYNNPQNNPGTTWIGDLYRNFGVLGIFPGMFLAGIIYRAIYSFLIEGRPVSPLRGGIYYLLITTTMRFEAQYSLFLPLLIRLLLFLVFLYFILKVVDFIGSTSTGSP